MTCCVTVVALFCSKCALHNPLYSWGLTALLTPAIALGQGADAATMPATMIVKTIAACLAMDPSHAMVVPPTTPGCRLAASAKGEAGVAPEATAAIAAGELLELLAAGACVDEHLADQLVIFMALARGRWVGWGGLVGEWGESRPNCCRTRQGARMVMSIACDLTPDSSLDPCMRCCLPQTPGSHM